MLLPVPEHPGRHRKNKSDADRWGELGDPEISPYPPPGNCCLGKPGRYGSLFDLAGKRFDNRYCSSSGREKAVIVLKQSSSSLQFPQSSWKKWGPIIQRDKVAHRAVTVRGVVCWPFLRKFCVIDGAVEVETDLVACPRIRNRVLVFTTEVRYTKPISASEIAFV